MTRITLASALLFSLISSIVLAQPPVRAAEQPRSVTLTLAEYNRLLDLERRAPVTPPAPPVAAIVSSADLKITIDRDNARGAFTLNGQVLHTGLVRVPLVHAASLLDATSGGRPVPLVTEGQTLQALINGPGPFSIRADWGSPLVFSPGRASFVLPVPQAGAARATIDLPGEQADVRLSAGLITRRSVEKGRTIVKPRSIPAPPRKCGGRCATAPPSRPRRELRSPTS